MPDFVICCQEPTGNRYEVIEIERPGKDLVSQQGVPRREMVQAHHQIAEFRDYILHHDDLLQNRFPGIESNYKTALIMSRASIKAFGGGSPKSYMALLRQEVTADNLLTYDDLVMTAKLTYQKLLGPSFAVLATNGASVDGSTDSGT